MESWLKIYLDEFVSSTGLSQEDSEELFSDFDIFFKNTIVSLDTALAKKDFSSISNFAHQIKGAAGSLLIEPVFELALSVETASKKEDETECTFQMEKLKKFITYV